MVIGETETFDKMLVKDEGEWVHESGFEGRSVHGICTSGLNHTPWLRALGASVKTTANVKPPSFFACAGFGACMRARRQGVNIMQWLQAIRPKGFTIEGATRLTA